MTIVFSGQPGQWLGIAGNTILRPSGQIGFEFDEAGGPGRLICRSDEAGAARSFLVADAARPGTPGRFDLPIQRGRGRQAVLRRFSNDEFLAPPTTAPRPRPDCGGCSSVRPRLRAAPPPLRAQDHAMRAGTEPSLSEPQSDLASPAGRKAYRPGVTGRSHPDNKASWRHRTQPCACSSISATFSSRKPTYLSFGKVMKTKSQSGVVMP